MCRTGSQEECWDGLVLVQLTISIILAFQFYCKTPCWTWRSLKTVLELVQCQQDMWLWVLTVKWWLEWVPCQSSVYILQHANRGVKERKRKETKELYTRYWNRCLEPVYNDITGSGLPVKLNWFNLPVEAGFRRGRHWLISRLVYHVASYLYHLGRGLIHHKETSCRANEYWILETIFRRQRQISKLKTTEYRYKSSFIYCHCGSVCLVYSSNTKLQQVQNNYIYCTWLINIAKEAKLERSKNSSFILI